MVKKNILQLGLPNRIEKMGEKSCREFAKGGVTWSKYGEWPIARQLVTESSDFDCVGESGEIIRIRCYLIDVLGSGCLDGISRSGGEGY